MTYLNRKVENAKATRLVIENFRSYAWAELADSPPWKEGICFNPGCCAEFEKARDWQIYCSVRCQQLAHQEDRKYGAKMALPLLIHRMGKYAEDGTAQKALVTVARRYVTHVQSEWRADRQARMTGGNHG